MVPSGCVTGESERGTKGQAPAGDGAQKTVEELNRKFLKTSKTFILQDRGPLKVQRIANTQN